MAFKMEKLHAFIATENDGTEGVVAMYTGIGWMPMVAADFERVQSLKPKALEIARATGKRIVLAEFSVRTDIEEIDP